MGPARPVVSDRKAASRSTSFVFKGDGAIWSPSFERNLRIFEQVLRYMTTQIDPNRPPIELHRPRRDGLSEDGGGDGDDEPRAALSP